MRKRSLPTLMSMPLRRRVACIDEAIRVPVYPCNRSTYGRGRSKHARMQTVAFTRWDPLRDLLTLHEPIDVEAVSADLKDGVLTVTLPKARGRGARRIDVS